MRIYWAIFLVLAVFAFLSNDKGPFRSRLLFAILASLPCALMIGLRWKIGPDWNSYLDIFNYTKRFSAGQSLTHEDPGFMLLMHSLHVFHAPFWMLNAIAGLIFIAGLTAFALRQPNPWLAMLVAFPYLVIVIGMSGIRQSIAIGILCFALNAFEKERVRAFSALILLAALFHGSAILMLPICLFSYSRNKFQRLVLLAFGVFVTFFIFHDAFDTYFHRYSLDYIQSMGAAYRLAMNSLAAILFIALQAKFDLSLSEKRLWRNISLCTIMLIPVLMIVPSSTAVDRFVLYLFPLQMFVSSRIPHVISGRRALPDPVTAAVILYAALVQIVFLQFGTFSNYYIPYQSIFDYRYL